MQFKEWKLNDFLDMIMPPLSRLNNHPIMPYKTNNIMWVNTLVYGGSGMGKTELMRMMAEQAVARYPKDKMEAVNIGRMFADPFLNRPTMLVGKPIKMYYLDDMTGKKISEKQKENWALLRHIMEEKSGPNGLLLTVLATHRYHSLFNTLRDQVQCFIAKSIPPAGSSPYDINLLKKFIGDAGYDLLAEKCNNKLLGKPYKEWTVFRVYDIIGYFDTPRATKNYLESWNYY